MIPVNVTFIKVEEDRFIMKLYGTMLFMSQKEVDYAVSSEYYKVKIIDCL